MKKKTILAILLSSALSASPIQEYGDWDAPAHTATGLSTRKGKEPLEKEGHRDALEAVNHRPGSSSAPSTLENLPPEVLCTIFSFLEFEDINNVMSSSAEFANIIKNNHQIFLGKRRSFRELIKIQEMGLALFSRAPRPVSGISVDLANYGALHGEINREALSVLAYASEVYNAGGLLLVTPLEDIKLLLGNGKTKLDFGLGRDFVTCNATGIKFRHSAIPEVLYDTYYSEDELHEKIKLCMDANRETLKYLAYNDLSRRGVLGQERINHMVRHHNARPILPTAFNFIVPAQGLTQLTELHYRDKTSTIRLYEFTACLASLPFLKKLTINVESAITSFGFPGLPSSITPLKNVRELFLNLTDPLSARFAHARDDACLYREIPNMFPNLETLCFGQDSTDNLKTEDLDALRDTLPCLTHLTYASYTGLSRANRDHFAAALSVGQESLRTLNMFAYPPSGSNSLEVLLGYNHLESLTVPIWEPFSQRELQDNVLRVITNLPHLKDCTLRVGQTFPESLRDARISNKSLKMLTQGSSLETLTLADAYLPDPFDANLFLLSYRLKKLRLVDCYVDAPWIDSLENSLTIEEQRDIPIRDSESLALITHLLTGKHVKILSATIDVPAMQRSVHNLKEARQQEHIRTLLQKPWDCVAQALGHTQRAVDRYMVQPNYYVPSITNGSIIFGAACILLPIYIQYLESTH